ncbi:MAG: rhodanese-like domain-containing protein [Flavobacteriales bacterium]|nr:rhodanese-like domain-containing protein [Flavobacteriales bacterium]
MKNMLRALFGLAPRTNIADLLENGAIIIDVRSPSEYANGHVKGSLNIPLDELLRSMHRLPKDKPIITCCASGARSASAANSLRDHRFDAHNGGPWTKVQAAVLQKRSDRNS